jgi:hypothetical protein
LPFYIAFTIQGYSLAWPSLDTPVTDRAELFFCFYPKKDADIFDRNPGNTVATSGNVCNAEKITISM